jgi:hypothetical protein
MPDTPVNELAGFKYDKGAVTNQGASSIRNPICRLKIRWQKLTPATP